MVACGQVHVHPGRIVLDKFCQETAREYVVAAWTRRALHDVRDVTLKILQEFLADW